MEEGNTDRLVETLGSEAPLAEAGLARPRLNSVDWLRGLIMVIMALDHTRDFFAAGNFNPRDVNDTALFLTRWITHYCAPTFIFLAGMSAYLYGSRGRSTSELSRFLLTRGLWLVLLEILVIRPAWSFNLQMSVLVLQVIWAIGVSMVCLSALVYLPRRAIAAFGLSLIAGHNLLDGIRAEHLGSWGWLWMLLHQQGRANVGGWPELMILYPLVPWIGVMAAGYAFGPVLRAERGLRQRRLLQVGLTVTGLFVLLRALNIYGDPQHWSTQGTVVATVLSFLNCEKYPPSLLYLCMTLGPAILLLRAAENREGRAASVLVTFGRVPFLFYVAHIVLLHLFAVAFAKVHDGVASWLFNVRPFEFKPAEFGLGLPAIYVVWLIAVAMLYPLCRWFAGVKQRRRDWWLSYL